MDGLKVNLDLQYQYRLIPELDEVLKLYYTWGYRHKYCFALVARNVLRDVASNFTAYEFFYNRELITELLLG